MHSYGSAQHLQQVSAKEPVALKSPKEAAGSRYWIAIFRVQRQRYLINQNRSIVSGGEDTPIIAVLHHKEVV